MHIIQKLKKIIKNRIIISQLFTKILFSQCFEFLSLISDNSHFYSFQFNFDINPENNFLMYHFYKHLVYFLENSIHFNKNSSKYIKFSFSSHWLKRWVPFVQVWYAWNPLISEVFYKDVLW